MSEDKTLQATTARVPRRVNEHLRAAWASNPAQLSRGKLVTEALVEFLPEFEYALEIKRKLRADTTPVGSRSRLKRALGQLAQPIDMGNDGACDVLSIRLPVNLKRRATFIFRNDAEAEFRSVAHVIASALLHHLQRHYPQQVAPFAPPAQAAA